MCTNDDNIINSVIFIIIIIIIITMSATHLPLDYLKTLCLREQLGLKIEGLLQRQSAINWFIIYVQK